jgi:hypothetical protein
MQSKLEGIVKGKGKSGCLRTIVVFEDVSMTERNMCQQVMSLNLMALWIGAHCPIALCLDHKGCRLHCYVKLWALFGSTYGPLRAVS